MQSLFSALLLSPPPAPPPPTLLPPIVPPIHQVHPLLLHHLPLLPLLLHHLLSLLLHSADEKWLWVMGMMRRRQHQTSHLVHDHLPSTSHSFFLNIFIHPILSWMASLLYTCCRYLTDSLTTEEIFPGILQTCGETFSAYSRHFGTTISEIAKID